MVFHDQPGNRFPHRRFGRIIGWLVERIGDLSVWSDIRAFPPLAVWGGVHCVAAMLWFRRSADAGSLKLTSTQIWVTATIAAFLVVAARAMLARVEQRAPVAWLRLVAACLSATPIVTLFFGSSRRLPLGTAAYLGMLTFVVWLTTWLWNRDFMERLLKSFLHSPSGAPLISPAVPLAREPGIEGADAQRRDEAETLRLKRTAGVDGSDRLEGAMVAEFASGQVLATLHVPFFPTFTRAPALVCEIDEKVGVRIKGTAVYPYGCRVELKRAGDPSATARIEVRFSATLLSSLARAA